MHGKHVYAKVSCGLYCVAYCVWDVVEFEIEKNAAAGGNHLADKGWAFVGIELQPDFIESGVVPYKTHQLPCFSRGAYIQRHDQAIASLQGGCCDVSVRNLRGHTLSIVPNCGNYGAPTAG